ncbi:5-hydroxytryptamine receptor [Culex quinquefasciatus]|uniref:5-hydroxytryptamine receptor n=1 Tax=Culex quinquefasciatus TaxID=7176 RepID=UPI0018E2AE45|nr:5-hydroxytryptamine receptor [Culex quinquefasciatus]XP_039442426.1 5-hydroxytryptamine receptor-like isoform X2 [Culex pipiens pallens]
MDFHKAPPPRPPSLGTSLAKSSADVYDYIFIDSGSPDSYLAAGELGALTVNETLLMLGGNGTVGNGSDLGNGTATGADEPLADVITMAVTSLILGLMILITVIGNVFVIAAIILERNLQNVANYLVASLAVADLLVACLVMPLGAVYEISRGWILGPELCDIWTSCDVLCCTASILHLVAIATDRYWAVTNIDYMHSRTSRRVFTMIFLVWFASVIVSLAPQFGWKDPDYLQRIEQQKCMVSQDIAYQIFATCCTFYVPLLVILVLYWKIYQTARRRIHRRRPKAPPAAGNNNQEETPKQTKSRIRFRLKKKFANPAKSAASSLGLVEGNSTNTVNTVEDTEGSSAAERRTASGVEETPISAAPNSQQIPTVSHEVATRTLSEPLETNNNSNHQPPVVRPTASGQLAPPGGTHHNSPVLLGSNAASHTGSTLNIASTPNPHAQVSKRKETLEAKRERKAAKTLAIITGAFVVCWLPFFLMALLLPLCESCYMNDTIASLFLWLGYFNSTLNPVIYTIFSPEFRQAFKRILFGTHRSSKYRRGKL